MARKHKNKDTLQLFALLIESLAITSESRGIRGCDMWFTKSHVMSELFITRYHATKLLDTAVKLGIFVKHSNRYKFDVESQLNLAIFSLCQGY